MIEFALSDGHNQHRTGWGMIPGGVQWGGYDVGGLIGSITDGPCLLFFWSRASPTILYRTHSLAPTITICVGGGYAFFGNGLWYLSALAPVPRYAPEFSRAIAIWIYNLANAMKYFFGDHPSPPCLPHHTRKHALTLSTATNDRSPSPAGDSEVVRHTQSNPHDRWDEHDVVAYEGLRKCDWCRAGNPQCPGAPTGHQSR